MTPDVVSTTSTPMSEGHVNNRNGNGSIPNHSKITGNGNNSKQVTDATTKRIDLEKLVVDFQKKLGDNWDRYQSALCLFLLGKLSRQELSDELAVVLDKRTARMHNQLLLANLANSLRDSPMDGFSSVGFGGPLSKKQKRKTSSQYEKIKKDIMALPPRERRRLKNIQRDSGKKHMVTSSLTMTRQELLPKIPLISKNSVSNGSATASSTTDIRINNTALWTQEIIQGISTLNSSESYEMPDLDSLNTKMTGIMREHGLIGKINDEVTKIMLLGLETHLKTVMESIIDVVRYRKKLYASDELLDTVAPSRNAKNNNLDGSNKKKNKKITVTVDDLFDTFQQLPLLIDFGGPLLRLSNSLLKNDDDVEDELGIGFDEEDMIHKSTTTTNNNNNNTTATISIGDKENPAKMENNKIVSTTPLPTAVTATTTTATTATDNNNLQKAVALNNGGVVKNDPTINSTDSAKMAISPNSSSNNDEFGSRNELKMLLRDILTSS